MKLVGPAELAEVASRRALESAGLVPEDLDASSNETLADLTDDNLDEGGILAYAFTNPLFFDVDGDGWVPAGVANAPCSP